MARLILVWAGALGALCVFAGGASAAVGAASCSTHGLAISGVRVVGLRVEGVPCAKARTVAGTIAHDLAHGKSVSVSGAQGFAMNEETCTGCKTTTSISIQYAHGKITVSIRGGSGSVGGVSPVVPTFPGVPNGSGTVI